MVGLTFGGIFKPKVMEKVQRNRGWPFFFFLEITAEYGLVLTSKYKYITTRLRAMNVCVAHLQMNACVAKNFGAWTEKVGHPCSRLVVPAFLMPWILLKSGWRYFCVFQFLLEISFSKSILLNLCKFLFQRLPTFSACDALVKPKFADISNDQVIVLKSQSTILKKKQ